MQNQIFRPHKLIEMKIKSTVILALFFSTALVATAQPQQASSVTHDILTIESRVLGETRTVLVRVPGTYANKETRYPVLYMLDAHTPQNQMAAGIVDQQAWGGKMPEMIIVGIQNIDRTRDMTPTKTERPNSGGAEKFLEFIEKEVFPLVEKNYRTEPFRVFAGHSLGGLAAVYAFVSRPQMFNAYIAASPVLHWDKDYVIKRAEEVLKEKKDWKKTMFLGLGNEPDYVAGFNSFKQVLKKADAKGFEYEFQTFPNDNHGSVVLPAYYAGLRKIFSDWPPPDSLVLSEQEYHHKKLSEKYGYTIKIPENLLNQIGYRLLQTSRVPEAITAFSRNVELYPNSANCYDSLAEAFEKDGQLRKAKENYEKAYKLAEANGEVQLAKTSKENFNRLTPKTK